MAYIGSPPAYQASGVRPRDEFTADGTQICYPLSQSVPGSFESGVTIVLDNVPQQPVEAFTVVDTTTLTFTAVTGTFTKNETVTGGTSSATGTVLKVNLGSIVVRGLTGTFANGETITGGSSSASGTSAVVSTNTGSGILFSEIPASGAFLYVVHEGNATYNLVPAAASVSATQLADNLRNFTVDTFTGDGSTTAFALSAIPASGNAILVSVDGIFQTVTTNYTLSSNTVTFTAAPDSGSAITIIHLGFSTASRTGLVDGSVTTAKIADGSITSAKIADGTVIAADVANGAITPAKLSTGGPSWASTGQTTINSTSAASSVILNSTNAGGAALNIQNNGTVNSLLGGYNAIVGSGNATDVMLSATQGALAFGTGASSTERVRVDTSGNLLVGASSNPNSLYKIIAVGTDNNNLIGSYNTASGNSAIRIQANQAGLYVQGSGTVDPLYITNTSATGYISFRPASDTERFRIGAAGQLGIGGANYGTAGQVLISGGASAAPSWGTSGKLLQTVQLYQSSTRVAYSSEANVALFSTGFRYTNSTKIGGSLTKKSATSYILIIAQYANWVNSTNLHDTYMWNVENQDCRHIGFDPYRMSGPFGQNRTGHTFTTMFPNLAAGTQTFYIAHGTGDSRNNTGALNYNPYSDTGNTDTTNAATQSQVIAMEIEP
jgi:Phage T7 tail fibre protein